MKMKGSYAKSGRVVANANKRVSGNNTSLFEYKGNSVSDVSGEVVKADLMNNGYRAIRTIGEGAYAKVKLADVMAYKIARKEAMAELANDDGELQVAVKIVDKRNVPKEFLRKFLPRELENHAKLPPHPNLCSVLDHFSTPDHVYIVMEYCPNGDLLDLINKHIGDNQKGIGEDTSRKLFTQVCHALRHVHNACIVHRDIKCENILLDDKSNAKLTDFGFSCAFDEQASLLKTSCGSYAYTAPEVIRSKPYDGFKSDVWSLGIILFAMVNGRLPFNDNQIIDMEEEMKMQRLKFERHVSFDCIVLIRKLLQFSPNQRPTLSEIMNDTWLTGKKPIPRQLNRPKWVNPYQGNKPNTNEINNEKGEQEKCEKSPRTSEPVCYKATPTKTMSTVTGTVTVNQQEGETVTLKTRGRMNLRYVGHTRPSTWPRTTKGTPESTSNVTRKKTSKEQTYKGPDIRRIAQLMLQRVNKHGDKPLVQQKEISEQIPFWLVKKILESESENTENNGVVTGSDKKGGVADDRESSPSPNPCYTCPACSADCRHPRTPRASRRVVSPYKGDKYKTANVSARKTPIARREPFGARQSQSPGPVKCISPKKEDVSSRPASHPHSQFSPAPHPAQSSPRQPMTRASEARTASAKTSATSNASSMSCRSPCSVKKVTPDVPRSPVLSKSADGKRAFRPPETTHAQRAKSSQKRLIELYGNRMFVYDGQMPLPPLYGQMCSFVEKSYNNAAKAYMESFTSGQGKSGREKRGGTKTTSTAVTKSSSSPKHKIIIHCS